MGIKKEQDIESLRYIALIQETQIRLLLEQLRKKCNRIDDLTKGEGEFQSALALLERLPDQEQGNPGGKKAKGAGGKDDKEPQTGHGPTPQPEVEQTEKLFLLDEADLACPDCGQELNAIREQYEASEMVDIVKISYQLVTVKRQKYSCSCGHIETADGPERAVAGGRYSLEFAVNVIIDKYVGHLPLSRQERIMKRHGLKTASQTLWDQLWVTSKLLKPTYDALYAAALREPVIGLDQTSWKRLEDKRKKPWQIWCISTPTAIYHQIFDDKGVDSWNELLGSYAGTVICDCLSTHGAKGCNKPGPTLAGCWAHVFRRFREAEEDFSDAGAALEMIQELYDIDARAESIEHLAILRKTESKQVTERLLAWLKSMPVLKITNFGATLHYVHGHWARFTRFLTDPLIPLDNNRTERAFRGPVIGRRNHFGSKSRRGTRVAALFYSLIESAKLNGINPAEYLMAAVLAARDGRVILPHEYNPPDD